MILIEKFFEHFITFFPAILYVIYFIQVINKVFSKVIYVILYHLLPINHIINQDRKVRGIKMKSINLIDIIELIGGVLLQGPDNLKIGHIITVPGVMKRGTLFFNMDNHSFDKLKKNQMYPFSAIVSSIIPKPGQLDDSITLIKVRDVEEAFLKFVEYYRGFFSIPVIGVTGTNGKTTTKEMIAHILSEKYKVNSTYRSKNSLSSNLKYLLRMDNKIEAGVFEMPVYCPGSLLKACKFLKPQVGIITNIGIDHIEGCRTPESYIKAKAEFLEGLDNDGTIILNNDDKNIKKIQLDKYKGEIIYFGFSKDSDFRVLNVNNTDAGEDFTFQYDSKNYHAFIPALGEFNVLNALAAIAAVHSIGIEIEYAIDRIASFKNIEGHFQPH
ncbi:MAG: hypothetical protein K0R09_1, partial [Clostridiales bacterium]|nr:hypothetical protein [Clostridiales bacterium]